MDLPKNPSTTQDPSNTIMSAPVVPKDPSSSRIAPSSSALVVSKDETTPIELTVEPNAAWAGLLSTPLSSDRLVPTSHSSQEEEEDNSSVAVHKETKKDRSPAPPRNRKSVGTAGALNKTYLQFIQEAILDMKEYRTGSSLASIKKWIVTHYPALDCDSPHFNARINVALKNGVAAKKFVKVRCSYKLATEFRNQMRNLKRKKPPSSSSTVATTKTKPEARTAESTTAATAPKNGKAEARARHIADRLRRRRFPMEDTLLHKEDKEFGVKPPASVSTRPHLPFFWSLPSLARTTGGKTSTAILTASKVEGCDYDSRGLVPDLLQIYHFFRGDVHFTLDDAAAPLVPNFTLQHLIHSVEQVWNGQARRAKLIPPLLVHLFVTCLQILTLPPPPPKVTNSNTDEPSLTLAERQLRHDLASYLAPALSPASWPDVTYLYMDAMQRYYSTDASCQNDDPHVLPPLHTDAAYLCGRTAAPNRPVVPLTPHKSRSDAEYAPQHALPDGYLGYLGDERSALCRAHGKLARQDPWALSAEELLALLRALTEDILATHPAVSGDMAQREEELFELLKVKKAAELKFRKIRLAYEGPKKPSRAKPKTGEESKNGEVALEGETEGDVVASDKPFQPTATKKQFDAAAKALEKANDAYEKGTKKLVARTVPVGYDRHYNAVYCFPHDPEVLYVEEKKPPSSSSHFVSSSAVRIPRDLQFPRTSWHFIDTTSLCDKFAASLDVRGRREHDLCEALMGPTGSGMGGLFRFLFDDLQEKTDAQSRARQKRLLQERLEAARIKCDEEKGRRSGRLAGQADFEFMQIQTEMEEFEKSVSNKRKSAPVAVERDYYELTGYNALVQFETSNGPTRRATREKKVVEPTKSLPLMHCSKLCSTGNIDGTGLIGMLVSSMLDLEEHCNDLAAWDRTDMSRSSWITRLENAVSLWHSISPDMFVDSTSKVSATPTDSPMHIDSSSRTPSKRGSMGSEGGASVSKRSRKTDSPGTMSSTLPTASSIVSLLKQPLLDLEERVADITNVALATRDADLADDNMSVDSTTDNEANRERLESEWKRQIHKLRNIPSKRQAQIRAVLVDAITAARKAHLQQIVTELRACLLMFRPNAPSDSKVAAIQLLVAHGDYELNDENDNEAEEGGVDAGTDDPAMGEDAVPSVLSAEAAMLRSSLGGSDDARREDWIGMVKSVKTISRLASFATAFIRDAMEKIEKLESERDELNSALQAWSKAEERQSKQRDAAAASKVKSNGATLKEVTRPSEVWANVRYTDQICMAKTDEYPWWPAKVCEAKDPEIAKLLKQLKRSLVAFVGEMGSLRVVKTSHLQPFTGQSVEEGDEMSEYTKDIRNQLEDCMAMARRIQRGLAKSSR